MIAGFIVSFLSIVSITFYQLYQLFTASSSGMFFSMHSFFL